MELLGLEETLNRLAKANGIQLYGHVLRRANDEALRRASNFEVVEKRRHERSKIKWKRQMVKQVEEIGQKKQDAIDRPKRHGAVNKVSRIMG